MDEQQISKLAGINVLCKFHDFCGRQDNIDYEAIEKLPQEEVRTFVEMVTRELFEGARYLETLMLENKLPPTIDELQEMCDKHLKGAPGIASHVKNAVDNESSSDSSEDSSDSSSSSESSSSDWPDAIVKVLNKSSI